MRFVAFHLMPYAEPGIAEAIDQQDPKTAWVTLPNSNYDPKVGTGLYTRYLDELQYAAESGFDGVAVNEHHQNAYGTMPNPNIMAAALTQRVKTAQICILGNAIPLTQPLHIAEQVAMLDVMSGGRVVSGFVRGIGFEYSTFGVDPNESRERFHEAHDLIIRAWTEPGPFSHHGEYYHYEYVNTWPRPVQDPHPAVWIPSQGSSETVDWTAEHRYVYLQTFTKLDRVVGIMDEFRKAARSHGYEADPEQQGWAIPVYVAETDKKAREEYAPHIEMFFNSLITGPLHWFFPPGYLTPASHGRVVGAKSEVYSHSRHTLESLERDGMVVVGSPDTVAQKIKDVVDATGVGVILPFVQTASMSHENSMSNIRLLGEEVIPQLRDHQADPDKLAVSA